MNEQKLSAVVGRQIKARRKELKMSARELAELAGYKHIQHIYRIENGNIDISINKLQLFAELLQCSITYLMSATEPPMVGDDELRPLVISDRKKLIKMHNRYVKSAVLIRKYLEE